MEHSNTTNPPSTSPAPATELVAQTAGVPVAELAAAIAAARRASRRRTSDARHPAHQGSIPQPASSQQLQTLDAPAALAPVPRTRVSQPAAAIDAAAVNQECLFSIFHNPLSQQHIVQQQLQQKEDAWQGGTAPRQGIDGAVHVRVCGTANAPTDDGGACVLDQTSVQQQQYYVYDEVSWLSVLVRHAFPCPR
jgi:hypothetical protein